MPDIELTKVEYDDEIHAHFNLAANSVGAIRAEPRSVLSALVSFPCGDEGALQTDVGRQAHEQLLEHLEAFVQELREILKP